MTVDLDLGDLVTGSEAVAPLSIGGSMLARQAGTLYWTLRVPRCSIMTVVDVSTDVRRGVVTVLHDGQLIELFSSSIQRMKSVEQ